MNRKCKQNINLDNNHLIKKFKDIFLNTQYLELCLINKKLIGTSWLEGLHTESNFTYNIPNGMSIDFNLSKKNIVQGLIINSDNKNYEIMLSNLKHLYNLIQGILVPYSIIVQIYGTGFKFNITEDSPSKTNIIEIYAGFNKKRTLILPKNVYAYLIDINTLKLTSKDKEKITLVGNKLKKIKPINKYKLRGIKLQSEKFIPKTYKKK